MNVELCESCGKQPRYQRKGKTYKLCVVCGWEAISALLNIPDDLNKTPEQKVTEALDYVPYEEWAK
jgi:hypothetical protein